MLMPDATLGQVKDFFGYPTLAAFSADWKQVSNEDRAQIRAGIGDGTLTY
jgi:hypothetical protein